MEKTIIRVSAVISGGWAGVAMYLAAIFGKTMMIDTINLYELFSGIAMDIVNTMMAISMLLFLRLEILLASML